MSGTAAPGPGIVLVGGDPADAPPPTPRGTPGRPLPIVIDCDPGHDDAVAILLALSRPDLRVLGISTVGGNAVLESTTDTALRVLALAGRQEIEVAAGAAHPLDGPLHTAPHVHGESGIEGPELPPPASAAIDEFAPHAMARWIRASTEPVVLVPTGPLTNVALLLAEHPDVRERIAHVCLMGGSVTEGNITPAAEFNIWVDPEAADAVFASGLPITMIGLDVTHRSIVWEPERDRIAAGGGRVALAVAGLLAYFQAFHERTYGWAGTPIHDAVAVAHLVAPSLVRTAAVNVEIETAGRWTRGRTVVDLRRVTGRPPNAHVGLDIDRERFVALLEESIRSYS
ncbi:MAG: nucleoside hydrolase [Chloroflexota bacterium]